MFLVCLMKRMKSLLMNFSCMFESFFLPLLLVILFSITIPDAKYMNFSSIPVSLIGSSENYSKLYHAMQVAKSSTGENLFQVSLCTKVVATDKLASGDIVAYIETNNGFHITAKSGEAKAAVIKAYVDWYESVQGDDILNMDMQYAIDKCAEKDFNRNEIYFLSLLAFVALSSLYWGVRMVLDFKGDYSVGTRMMVAPVSKAAMAYENILAVFTISFFENAAIVLAVDRLEGMNLIPYFSYIMVVLVLTSIVGIEIGVYIGILDIGGEKFKHRLCSAIMIISSFLAGLFMFKIRYVIDDNVPLIAVLNPVHVATDALYCIYFTYEMEQYTKNLLILCCLAIALAVGIILLTRRKNHVRV